MMNGVQSKPLAMSEQTARAEQSASLARAEQSASLARAEQSASLAFSAGSGVGLSSGSSCGGNTVAVA